MDVAQAVENVQMGRAVLMVNVRLCAEMVNAELARIYAIAAVIALPIVGAAASMVSANKESWI